MPGRALLRPLSALAPAGVAAALLSGCAFGSLPTGGPLRVAAAENVWGSIAAQLGGDRASVRSIVSGPGADPHDYEPSAADARTIASARCVIYNGIGYDPWARRLVKANPRAGRAVIDVGEVVGIGSGGNPHRWYSPDDVARVVDRITAAFDRLSPRDRAYFDQRRTALLSTGLGEYHALIAAIRARYAGTPVGASESVFAPLADALGLRLLTPRGFLDAVSEGGEPTAADKARIDAQIRDRRIKVFVFNAQNSTPDVSAQIREAEAAGIPVASITETLAPAGATFQEWQVAQLRKLQAALATTAGP